MATNAMTDDPQVQHIGSAPHTIHNIMLGVAALVVMAVLIGLFAWRTSRSDGAATAELSQFRQTMYNRCKDPQFAGPADSQLTSLYADSSRMRTVVVEQFHQLQRDNADCQQVAKALRAADYPIK
jgi:hypothetical protein